MVASDLPSTEAFFDFRSDTVTRPTPAMLQAMMHARVGDDVFGDDPTVHQLEEEVAGLLGKEAAMFVASGTMSNQLAMRVHVGPLDEVMCDHRAHIVRQAPLPNTARHTAVTSSAGLLIGPLSDIVSPALTAAAMLGSRCHPRHWRLHLARSARTRAAFPHAI
jgi:hypothetical protein